MNLEYCDGLDERDQVGCRGEGPFPKAAAQKLQPRTLQEIIGIPLAAHLHIHGAAHRRAHAMVVAVEELHQRIDIASAGFPEQFVVCGKGGGGLGMMEHLAEWVSLNHPIEEQIRSRASIFANE